MRERFTYEWSEILNVLSHTRNMNTEGFLIRYAFQTLAHCIWRE